jgi:histone deacetylase 6
MKRRAPSPNGVHVQSKRDDLPVHKTQVSSPPHTYTHTLKDSRSRDDQDENDCSPVAGTIRMSSTLAVTSPQLPGVSGRNDLRTGLVLEVGIHHFDPHNRLPRERPCRILDIQKALQMSTNKLWSRCHIMSSASDQVKANSSSNDDDISHGIGSSLAAARFLDDEDFLRVHLPGYMKRYVTYRQVPIDQIYTNSLLQFILLVSDSSSSIPDACIMECHGCSLDRIFACHCCTDDRLALEAEQFQSIYFAKGSLTEAKKAAASLCFLVEQVVQGKRDNGFAIIRPPGHHAEPFQAGGYCIINNVAVAAAYARQKLGVAKVLIVDWDVHHGNGTQAIFQKDPNVFYFSVHRWHGGNFYPYGSNGGPNFVGVGEGKGRTVNVGWTSKGMGDDEYLAVWERVLLPMATEYQPNLILVSAGFDAANGDLGECCISPECYGRMTRSLMTLNAPIVCALEGGYVRTVLGACVCQVVTSLLDRQGGSISQQEDSEDRKERGNNTDILDAIQSTAAKNILATMVAHGPYWRCLSVSSGTVSDGAFVTPNSIGMEAICQPVELNK